MFCALVLCFRQGFSYENHNLFLDFYLPPFMFLRYPIEVLAYFIMRLVWFLKRCFVLRIVFMFWWLWVWHDRWLVLEGASLERAPQDGGVLCSIGGRRDQCSGCRRVNILIVQRTSQAFLSLLEGIVFSESCSVRNNDHEIVKCREHGSVCWSYIWSWLWFREILTFFFH